MSAATLSPNPNETKKNTPFVRSSHRRNKNSGSPYLWTVENYHRAIEAGVFAEDPYVELIDGVLVRTMPEKPPHVTSLDLAISEVARVFALIEAYLRIQHPVTLRPRSEPEPDICVVRGRVRDYATRHPAPADILLLIEISDSTLAFDRANKARVYARAGIAEYWILNVNARTLEVYQNPQNGTYPTATIYDETQTVLPLNAPTTAATIAVADLLP